MPIKTLHLINAYHQKSGGIATFYRTLLAAAERTDRKLTLLVPAEHDAVETYGPHCRIYHIAARPAPFFDRRYRWLGPPSYLPGLRGRLRDILRAEQPDLVEVCDKYALNWLAGLWRISWLRMPQRPALVGMSHERMDDNIRAFVSEHAWARNWTRRYLGYCYVPLFDYHLANSEYTADELRTAMVEGHERPLHVVPMGADFHAFAALERNEIERQYWLAQLGASADARLLLYAGRLSPEKNVRLLWQMMEALNGHAREDYHLLIAGDGPLTAQLRAINLPKVHLLGHLDHRAQLLSLYANCDAFVHPNPREPFGIAPLEAMAAGLPLVASHAGGIQSYANHESAWLAEPSAIAFAQAVKSIFTDSAQRTARIAQARQRAAQFDWAQVTARFFALYEQMHLHFIQRPHRQAEPAAAGLGARTAPKTS